MKFHNEAERAAWSSAWDAGRLAGLAPVFCAEGANDKIEAMRERQEPQPPRSERGALERVKKQLVRSLEAWKLTGCGEFARGWREATTNAIIPIDEELARQPADELPAKVAAVVEEARAWILAPRTDLAAEGRLVAAVKALDEEAK